MISTRLLVFAVRSVLWLAFTFQRQRLRKYGVKLLRKRLDHVSRFILKVVVVLDTWLVIFCDDNFFFCVSRYSTFRFFTVWQLSNELWKLWFVTYVTVLIINNSNIITWGDLIRGYYCAGIETWTWVIIRLAYSDGLYHHKGMQYLLIIVNHVRRMLISLVINYPQCASMNVVHDWIFPNWADIDQQMNTSHSALVCFWNDVKPFLCHSLVAFYRWIDKSPERL